MAHNLRVSTEVERAASPMIYLKLFSCSTAEKVIKSNCIPSECSIITLKSHTSINTRT